MVAFPCKMAGLILATYRNACFTLAPIVLGYFAQVKRALNLHLRGLVLKKPSSTPPETNSSPLKVGNPTRKIVFQPSIFRCYVLVSGRVVQIHEPSYLCWSLTRWQSCIFQSLVIKRTYKNGLINNKNPSKRQAWLLNSRQNGDCFFPGSVGFMPQLQHQSYQTGGF